VTTTTTERQDACATAGDLRERAATWRLLAQLLRREIDPGMARLLLESGLPDLLARQGYDLGPARLRGDDALRRLRQEYTKVFVGPGPHVSPYGSVHHPDDHKRGQLWGDTTTWMHRFVKDLGLRFEGAAYDGMPDHVGHELEVFAILLEREADAVEGAPDPEGAGGGPGTADGDRLERIRHAQRLLWGRQLSRWVPTFCDRVEGRAPGAFYGELARLLRDLVDSERGRLGPDQGPGAGTGEGAVA